MCVSVFASACMLMSVSNPNISNQPKQDWSNALAQSWVLQHTGAQGKCVHWMALLWVWRVFFFFCFLQSWGNNQLMCGILCQKWGNINFFAPGNLNISRKDINTIATPTHTHTITHMGFINLLCNRTLSSGFNITVNGDAYLQAVLPLK